MEESGLTSPVDASLIPGHVRLDPSRVVQESTDEAIRQFGLKSTP
jgi:hypothetical protein